LTRILFWNYGIFLSNSGTKGHAPSVGMPVRAIRSVVIFAVALLTVSGAAYAQSPTSNGGDPLFCQPNEGTTFLIINGGSGLFTVDPDCYNNNIGTPSSNTPPASITTTRGGTLTLNLTPEGGNYTYTPPSPNFVGTDTFTIHVTTTWNATGGPGSHGGTFLARPGGADDEVVTLNVLPATSTLQVAGAAKLVPIPTGNVTGCGPQGNAGQGPANSVVVGCVTALGLAPFNITTNITTAHGTVTTVGSGTGETLRYTPTVGYTGPDSFSYDIFGTNTDGSTALNSGTGAFPASGAGNALMQVTVGPPIVITNSSPLPNGAAGATYTAQTFAATGGFPLGSPTYTFSLASGTLPPGITLTSGVLSGTPTGTGVFNFTIQAADGASDSPNKVTKAFQITVGSGTNAAPVPTLGAWGTALLGAFLLLFGMKFVYRRADVTSGSNQ
jgi:hypothetical protein